MNETNDVAHRVSRRGFLTTAALGATGLVVATGSRSNATGIRSSSAVAASSCLTMTPTEEEGPFYVAYNHVRSNIRGGQAGVHLTLHLKVIDVTTCEPLRNAALDIWHANALGVYSAESSEGTVGQNFLRGIQLTDKHGHATFHTIMPGWYEGRVEHIHAKVRVKGKTSKGVYAGGSTSHTGQMFFPQKVNDRIAALPRYAANTQNRITNATDRIYTQQGGAHCRLHLTGHPSAGYVGHTTIAVKA